MFDPYICNWRLVCEKQREIGGFECFFTLNNLIKTTNSENNTLFIFNYSSIYGQIEL